MRGSDRVRDGAAWALRALALVVVLGSGSASLGRAADAAVRVDTPTRGDAVLVEAHRSTPPSPWEATSGSPERQSGEQETRDRRSAGPDSLRRPEPHPVSVRPPAVRTAPETRHERSLARAGRHAAWPTGPPTPSV